MNTKWIFLYYNKGNVRYFCQTNPITYFWTHAKEQSICGEGEKLGPNIIATCWFTVATIAEKSGLVLPHAIETIVKVARVPMIPSLV